MIDYEFEMSLQTFRRCIQVPSHIIMNLLYSTRFGKDIHCNSLKIFSEEHLRLFKLLISGVLKASKIFVDQPRLHIKHP